MALDTSQLDEAQRDKRRYKLWRDAHKYAVRDKALRWFPDEWTAEKSHRDIIAPWDPMRAGEYQPNLGLNEENFPRIAALRRRAMRAPEKR